MTVLLVTGQGRARAFSDPAEGRQLAAAWCSSCHQIDPQTQTFANDGVPSFKAIAAMSSTTMMSIRAFLRTSHDVMPNLKLTESQIDDVGAYILGLRTQPLN